MYNNYGHNLLLSVIHIYIVDAIIQSMTIDEQPTTDEETSPYIRSASSKLRGPMTPNFRDWLDKNGYADYDFARLEAGSQDSYGGRQFAGQNLHHRPIIFIHGNSDGALAVGNEEWSQGWSRTIEHFLKNGYTSAELYAISYGDRNLREAMQRTVDCASVLRIRRFIEAVLSYADVHSVNIVAHSMGVTLARIAIHGNTFSDVVKEGDEESVVKCFIGTSLHRRVHTLIGIAGANYGICMCANETMALALPACGKTTGFWTHSGCSDAKLSDCQSPNLAIECTSNDHQYSAMLQTVNRQSHRRKEANRIVSMWSRNDSILGASNLAWGHLTSLIPNSDRTLIYDGPSHHTLKWATVADQIAILENDEENGTKERKSGAKSTDKKDDKESKEF